MCMADATQQTRREHSVWRKKSNRVNYAMLNRWRTKRHKSHDMCSLPIVWIIITEHKLRLNLEFSFFLLGSGGVFGVQWLCDAPHSNRKIATRCEALGRSFVEAKSICSSTNAAHTSQLEWMAGEWERERGSITTQHGTFSSLEATWIIIMIIWRCTAREKEREHRKKITRIRLIYDYAQKSISRFH